MPLEWTSEQERMLPSAEAMLAFNRPLTSSAGED